MMPIDGVDSSTVGIWVGVGLTVVLVVLTFLAVKSVVRRVKQRQSGGDRSTNLQAGRDISVGEMPKQDDA